MGVLFPGSENDGCQTGAYNQWALTFFIERQRAPPSTKRLLLMHTQDPQRH